MAGNFTDFGDLVLIIGDFHVPQRAVDLPPCFRELLHTDKIRHVLCTGNVGNGLILDFLRGIAGSVHIVKGDMDEGLDFPEYKILQFGGWLTILPLRRHFDSTFAVEGNTGFDKQSGPLFSV